MAPPAPYELAAASSCGSGETDSNLVSATSINLLLLPSLTALSSLRDQDTAKPIDATEAVFRRPVMTSRLFGIRDHMGITLAFRQPVPPALFSRDSRAALKFEITVLWDR